METEISQELLEKASGKNMENQPEQIINNWTANPDGSITVEFSSARHTYNALYGAELFHKDLLSRSFGKHEVVVDKQIEELSGLQNMLIPMVQKEPY